MTFLFKETINLKANRDFLKSIKMNLRHAIMLIALLSFILPNRSIGQNLSLRELLHIQRLPVEETNDYLITKGWSLVSLEEKGNYSDFKDGKWPSMEASWEYNSLSGKQAVLKAEFYDDYNASKELFNLLEVVLLVYYTQDEAVWSKIKNDLTDYGFRKTGVNSGNGGLQTIYENQVNWLGTTTISAQTANTQAPVFVFHLRNQAKLWQ